MYPEERREQLLDLLRQANEPLTTEKLANELNVSIRTIQYDIQTLNDWLLENQLLSIRSIHQKGVVWEETKTINNLNKTEYTPLERKIRMLLLVAFYRDLVTTETFMERNNVSRTTVLQDLKELRSEMEPFQVSIAYDSEYGRIFSGKEKNIRYFLIQFLFVNEYSKAVVRDIVEPPNPNILKRLYEIENRLGIHFTDEMQERLLQIAHLFLHRIQAGCLVEEDTEFHYQLQSIGNHFYQGKAPLEEAQFLGKFLLGANRVHDETASETVLSSCIYEVIDRFELFASVQFIDRDQLKQDLLLHLKPAIFRIKYNLEIHHSMEESVKSSYPEIFEMTKYAIQPFENLLHSSLPDNELAFLAILFGGHLKKAESNLVKEKIVQVVCSMGVGTSRFIENQLKQLLPSRISILPPLSLRSFKEKPPTVDLVISTIAFETKAPVILVDPLLTEPQKQAILQTLKIKQFQNDYSVQSLVRLIEQHAQIHHYSELKNDLTHFLFHQLPNQTESKSSLRKFLTKPFIQFQNRMDSWQQAIHQAAEPLLVQNYITESYCHKMIENIEKYGPYVILAPGFAMPHARPEHGILQSGVSLLCLKEPVAFGEKELVSFIFILAIIEDNERLAILRQLGKLIPKLKSTNELEIHKSIETLF